MKKNCAIRQQHSSASSRAPVLYLPSGARHTPSALSVTSRLSPVIVNGTLSLFQDPASSCRLIETIQDPQDANRLLFLDWKDGEYAIVPEIEHGGRIFSPPKERKDVLADITLATGACEFGGLSELVSCIRSASAQFVEISDRIWQPIQAVVLASWFPELFEAAPQLWLVGPPESAKTKLLRLLSCFCRRALVVGDIRPAALYQLVDSWDTTLLIDELDTSGPHAVSDIMRLLRVGSTSGMKTVRNGRLFTTYGFKIIATRHLPSDAALASRAIVVSLLPTVNELEPLTRDAMHRLAREFQPQLLRFRLTRYPIVRGFRMEPGRLAGMMPRSRQLACILAAPLQEVAEAQSDLIAILQERDAAMRVDRFLEPEWLGTESLFAICHRQLTLGGWISESLVGGVAEQINATLKYRGENFTISARKASEILKSLGIRTERLGNLGRGLRFTPSLRRKIHELARCMGIDRTHLATLTGLERGYGGVPCQLCDEFRLGGGLRFVEPTPRRLRPPRADRIPLLDERNRLPSDVDV